MSTTHCVDLMAMEGTDRGLSYTIVARQLGHHRVVLETLQVCGHAVPLASSPTFGSLQSALDIGGKLAEQYIGQLLRKRARARPASRPRALHGSALD